MKPLQFILIMSMFLVSSCTSFQNFFDPTEAYANIEILHAVSYWNESVNLDMQLELNERYSPGDIYWLYPDTLAGTGPFHFKLTDTLQLKLELIKEDGKSKIIEFLLNPEDYFGNESYDYRKELSGNFQFTTYSESVEYIENQDSLYTQSNYDTIIYDGSISLLGDNYLLISYQGNTPKYYMINGDTMPVYYKNQINPMVDEDFNFFPPDPDFFEGGTKSFSGRFIDSNSLQFNITFGGQAYRDTDKVSGIRLE